MEQKRAVRKQARIRNIIQVRESHKRYNKEHSKEINEKSRARSAFIRKELLLLLGGKCVNCGFDNWQGLQIDHINGGGCQDIKSFKNTPAYQKAIRESVANNEGKYQILCANCNQIKRYYWGV